VRLTHRAGEVGRAVIRRRSGEWDIKWLAASLVVAARENGWGCDDCLQLVDVDE
jgi:hypothetical protein